MKRLQVIIFVVLRDNILERLLNKFKFSQLHQHVNIRRKIRVDHKKSAGSGGH